MTRKLVTWALMLGLSTILGAKEPTRQLLRELDAALANAATYEGYFQQRTDVLRQMLAGKNTPEQEYEIRKKLASEFAPYSLDSTVVQLNRNRALARQLGDAYRQAETDFALAREYALAGYHSDALDILSGYRLEAIPPGLEYTFFEVSSYLYGELAAYSSNNAQYWQKKDMYRVSMLPFLEEGTYEWYDLQRVQAESDRDQEKALEYGLDRIQLHGTETPKFCSTIRLITGLPVMKAISVESAQDFGQCSNYEQEDAVDMFLFDTKCSGWGGSGQEFDWSLLESYKGSKPFLLAGGIGPGMEQKILGIRHKQFRGIDLNSRFETEPALKEINKLSLFINNIRSYEQNK